MIFALIIEQQLLSLALINKKKVENLVHYPLTHEIQQLKIFNITQLYTLVRDFIGNKKIFNTIIVVGSNEGLYETISDQETITDDLMGYYIDTYCYGDSWYISALKREIVTQWHILIAQLQLSNVTITTRTLVLAYQEVPEVMTLEELHQTQISCSTEDIIKKLVVIY